MTRGRRASPRCSIARCSANNAWAATNSHTPDHSFRASVIHHRRAWTDTGDDKRPPYAHQPERLAPYPRAETPPETVNTSPVT